MKGLRILSTIWLALVLFIGQVSASNIPHALGLYVSENGQRFFRYHLDELITQLGDNKINIRHQEIEPKHKDLGEKTINELFPNNPSLTRLIQKAKYQFHRFFTGIRIGNKHHIQVDVSQINLDMDWEFMGLNFAAPGWDDPRGHRNGILMQLSLTIRDFRVGVDRVRVRDVLHDFIGDIGVNDIVLSKDSNPGLHIVLPVRIKLLSNGKFSFTVNQPQSNIDDIKLTLDYNRRLVVPTVDIFINGRRSRSRMTEIERMLRRKKNDLLTGLQKEAQEWVETQLPPLIDEIATEKVNEGLKEKLDLSPTGTEDKKELRRKYKLSVVPTKFEFLGEHLHLGVDARVKDPRYRRDLGLSIAHMAKGAPTYATLYTSRFDLAISLNEGLINRLIQLGRRRGYYSHVDGSNIAYRRQPYLEISRGRAGRDGRPRFSLSLDNPIDGWLETRFVSDPLRVDVDLFVKFVKKGNAIQILPDGFDLDSIYVPKSQIRGSRSPIGIPFFDIYDHVKDKVKKQLRDKARTMTEPLAEIELPLDQLGIPLSLRGSEIDSNGHILLLYDINR